MEDAIRNVIKENQPQKRKKRYKGNWKKFLENLEIGEVDEFTLPNGKILEVFRDTKTGKPEIQLMESDAQRKKQEQEKKDNNEFNDELPF